MPLCAQCGGPDRYTSQEPPVPKLIPGLRVSLSALKIHGMSRDSEPWWMGDAGRRSSGPPTNFTRLRCAAACLHQQGRFQLTRGFNVPGLLSFIHAEPETLRELSTANVSRAQASTGWASASLERLAGRSIL